MPWVLVFFGPRIRARSKIASVSIRHSQWKLFLVLTRIYRRSCINKIPNIFLLDLLSFFAYFFTVWDVILFREEA